MFFYNWILIKNWKTSLERNWDDIPSINIWTFPTTFQINVWTCQIILLIQESNANRNLSDASVVIVIGKDFPSLSSIDVRYTYAVNKLNDLVRKMQSVFNFAAGTESFCYNLHGLISHYIQVTFKPSKTVILFSLCKNMFFYFYYGFLPCNKGSSTSRVTSTSAAPSFLHHRKNFTYKFSPPLSEESDNKFSFTKHWQQDYQAFHVHSSCSFYHLYKNIV